METKKRRTFMEAKKKPQITPNEEGMLREIEEEKVWITSVGSRVFVFLMCCRLGACCGSLPFDCMFSILFSSLVTSMTYEHTQVEEEVAVEVSSPEFDEVVEETIEAGTEDDETGDQANTTHVHRK